MFQPTPLRLMVSTDLLAPKRFWLGRGGEQDLLVPEEAWAVAPASVNHGSDICLRWLSALWGLCRAQQGYCYLEQCLPEAVWEGRGLCAVTTLRSLSISPLYFLSNAGIAALPGEIYPALLVRGRRPWIRVYWCETPGPAPADSPAAPANAP